MAPDPGCIVQGAVDISSHSSDFPNSGEWHIAMADYVLIDTAVIAFANAMRIQSIIGNTSLILESEMFGQPTLRAKWKSEYGSRPEDICGIAAEEYVIWLRESLLPLVRQFHQMAGEAIDSLRRQRQMPAVDVERAAPRKIRLVAAERSSPAAIEQASDLLRGTMSRQPYGSARERPVPSRLAKAPKARKTPIGRCLRNRRNPSSRIMQLVTKAQHTNARLSPKSAISTTCGDDCGE